MRMAAALLALLSLSGCALAAVPLAAGLTVAATDKPGRKKPAGRPAALPTESPLAQSPAQLLPPEYRALLDHVRARSALWREGAPINSLVLDNRQTVLNPVAIDCARREPVVIIDADPAKAAGPFDPSSPELWRQTVAKIRSDGVAILWVTDRPDAEAPLLRAALEPAGIVASDTVAGRASATDRKQIIRQRWALTHCVLAVVGDTRGDADEAYDYLRNPDVSLPIDSNWGEGWFLLPSPAGAKGTN